VIAINAACTHRMRAAVANLTAAQQQALFLTIVKPRPIREVARAMGVPTPVARSIAAAARAKVFQAVNA
jgi:DNA-directed RNA polymerase specialized sigma24 family protein